jgi:putative transposase
MPNKIPHRKKVRHYHEPGDFHELTFSCYHRMPLLTNDAFRQHLARSIDDALVSEDFRLVSFVFMPEHVHLLVYPTRNVATTESVPRFLTAVKNPCSQNIKADLERSGSRLLNRLIVRERPGRTVFRFWQEGPGYDRNLQTETSVMAAIEYIHLNPVRRKLVETAMQWRWSSARWYASDGADIDELLPTIHGPPPELFGLGGS